MSAPTVQPPKPETPPEPPYPSARYAWYVVGVLTLVYIFSFIDRQILNLLVRPIRRGARRAGPKISEILPRGKPPIPSA